jgi:glutamate dehydrogenase/leucine dehydrogenase
MDAPLSLTPEEFADRLVRAGRRRASFTRREGALEASDLALESLARAVERSPDFADHEVMFFEVGEATGALHSAFLHKTTRGQGAGGVRHWRYETFGDLVKDGLRLSRGMGRKNALAGLFWGGGKGVIQRQAGERYKDPEYRRTLYEEYGRFMTSLRGAYVTAEDVGTTPPDMESIFRTTRFVTCIPETVGGSGNPSPATARGVVCAMEAALDHLGMGSLAGKRIAMQGTGNVGSAMIAELLERKVASVVAAEIDLGASRVLRERFAGTHVEIRDVLPGDDGIFEEECDVFAPNALGGVLSPRTIPKLGCKIVCGAANNQLEDDQRDDRALAERGILYVPDFVANRMGIVSCANEEYGSLPEDPSILRHFGREWDNSVYVITRRILNEAKTSGATTTEAANRLADGFARIDHPLFPGRSRDIVRALERDRWHEGRSSA